MLHTIHLLVHCGLQLHNPSRQWICFFEFNFRWDLVLGLQLFELFLRVKRCQSILLFFKGFLVLDIEPFGPLMLNRIIKGEFEILHIYAHNNDSTTNIVDLFLWGIAAKIEYSFPQPLVRVKAKEHLAQHDETRNVEDGIGRELVQWCLTGPVGKPQEEGMMSTTVSFPSLWNQSLIDQWEKEISSEGCC
jgi:hypothetical protein